MPGVNDIAPTPEVEKPSEQSEGEKALRGDLTAALSRVSAAKAALDSSEADAGSVIAGLAARLGLTRAEMRRKLEGEGVLEAPRRRAVKG